MATATQSARCKELDPRQQSSASCNFEDALLQKIVGQNEATYPEKWPFDYGVSGLPVRIAVAAGTVLRVPHPD